MALQIPLDSQQYVVLNSESPPAWVFGSRQLDISQIPQSIAISSPSFGNPTALEDVDLELAPVLAAVDIKGPPKPKKVDQGKRHFGNLGGKYAVRKQEDSQIMVSYQ